MLGDIEPDRENDRPTVSHGYCYRVPQIPL